MAFRPQSDTKVTMHGVVFQASDPTGPVNYPPFEPDRPGASLSRADREEVARQQAPFNIFPSGAGRDGKISHYTKRIPYSSDKKDFNNKTGSEAFNVFSYIFHVPGDAPENVFTVMWDYQSGLVRVTPFFKALKHNKTSPGRSLKVNGGLDELSHSITGGALAAQGYWMPMTCARAICATFCHEIAWALTPVFGFDFPNDCLSPTHPGFNKFKIDSAIVTQAAEAAAKGSKVVATPAPAASRTGKVTPLQATSRVFPLESKILPPRAARPTFNTSSFLDSDSESVSARSITPAFGEHRMQISPEISPKSTTRVLGSGWRSVNESGAFDTSSPPSLEWSSQPSLAGTPTRSAHHRFDIETPGPLKRNLASLSSRPTKRSKTSAVENAPESPIGYGRYSRAEPFFHRSGSQMEPAPRRPAGLSGTKSRHTASDDDYDPASSNYSSGSSDGDSCARFSARSVGPRMISAVSGLGNASFDRFDTAAINAANTLLDLRRRDDELYAQTLRDRVAAAAAAAANAAEGTRRRSVRRRAW